jgi:VCBS repeat-containing protein
LRFLAAPNFEAPTDADRDGIYVVMVEANDGLGGTATQTVAITVTDVNEAPVLNDAAFTLAARSANGTVVGAVTAHDPDAGQAGTVTYALMSGNTKGAFALDPVTGQLTVANRAALNVEMTPSFSLTVQATDAGTPALSSRATVTVALTRVRETDGPPVIPDRGTREDRQNWTPVAPLEWGTKLDEQLWQRAVRSKPWVAGFVSGAGMDTEDDFVVTL